MGNLYKLPSKALATKLEMELESIISQPQGAFMKGSHILDYSPIENTCIDNCQKDGKPGIVCQLDMDFVMLHVGFGQKWRNWISFVSPPLPFQF